MPFSVLILGAGSATPTLNRHPSSQLLTYESDHFLIDCGEGTQFRLLDYKVRPGRLKGIFISHLHGDHYFGLIGLLSSLNLGGRTDDLLLFGPQGLDEVLTLQFKYSQTPLQFRIIFTQTNTTTSTLLYEHPCFTVFTIPLSHRIPCAGFLFQEKPQKRKLIKEKITDGIPFDYLRQLKNGEDIYDEGGNLLYSVAEYTLPAPPPRSYAYCSDTRYDEAIIPIIRGASLLYHEATFQNDLAHQASARFHATASEAATIAKKANVGKLLIGHFSSRYKEVDSFLTEAQAVFPNSHIAEEGTTFNILSVPSADASLLPDT
ncbi:ribonuclease Z [Runella sp. SP2]|uniref:ribonuclease Z n=1 Tax=Runella sp. SP2 TaxID=2268026 RepID=UPI000F08232A|nr:ribonuclease Z [Runella sp. SP2]AYQ32338.1 ribonuclease Z [Runella sp. SP2]